MGIDGPVRIYLSRTFETLDRGRGARVHAKLDFEGHGIGRPFVFFPRQSARKETRRDCPQLKQQLERNP